MATDLMAALSAEYMYLQEAYEAFNEQSLTIKGWSVTVSAAAVVSAYFAAPPERVGRFPLALAGIVALPFWITDAYWKMFQNAYLGRIAALEEWFAKCTGGVETCRTVLAPNQITSFWTKAYKPWADKETGGTWNYVWGYAGELGAAMINPAVFLPHAPILLIAAILSVWAPPRSLPDSARREKPRKIWKL